VEQRWGRWSQYSQIHEVGIKAVSLGGNPGDGEAGVVELPYAICNPSAGEFLRAIASYDITVFFM